MGHNVGKAADNAVKRSQQQKLATRTPEEVLADIRRNLASNLAVTPSDQRFLLEQYDIERSAVVHLGESVKALLFRAESAEAQVVQLKAKIEEFRSVYETENQSMVLKVEKVLENNPEPRLNDHSV